MRHPEYPTSIRLSVPDKKRLRKLASKWQLSLAGLIQMIIKQWLEVQEKKNEGVVQAVGSQEPAGDGPVHEHDRGTGNADSATTGSLAGESIEGGAGNGNL